jgi:hypothetical protein
MEHRSSQHVPRVVGRDLNVIRQPDGLVQAHGCDARQASLQLLCGILAPCYGSAQLASLSSRLCVTPPLSVSNFSPSCSCSAEYLRPVMDLHNQRVSEVACDLSTIVPLPHLLGAAPCAPFSGEGWRNCKWRRVMRFSQH